MYTITYILNGQLVSISSPGMRAAFKTFYALRIGAGLPARLWKSEAKGQPRMIF